MRSVPATRQYPTAASVEIRASQALGLGVGTLHQFLHGEQGGVRRLEQLAQFYRDAGAIDLLNRRLARLDAIRGDRPVLELDRALEAEAEADAREDISEQRFLRTKTTAALAEALRDQERSIYAAMALRDSLLAELKRRERMV